MSNKKNKGPESIIRTQKESVFIDSATILSGRKEISIIHDNNEYKLRLTSNGKLILTK